MSAVSKEPKWGRVWRYEGLRGVSWRIRYTDAAGRRILETLGKEPDWNRRKAEATLRERLVDVSRDGYRYPDKTTFKAFADRWLSEHLPGRNLKQTTVESYQQTLRAHLVPAFGHLQLRVLEQQPELIDHYISQKTRAGYSPKTITNHLLILQVMLKRAVRWRLISRNPVTDCDRPRVEQPDLNVLTETEIARLWTAYNQLEHDAEEDSDKAWWRLARTITFTALTTALRRGEILALQWQDIHLLEHRLSVQRAIVRGQLTTPKSRRSRRLVEIGPRTAGLLSEHWQHTPFKADDDLVFAHPQLGTPLDPSKLSRHYLRPALKTAGITKPFRPFHDLRHTALTHEAAAGNPSAYIQMKAGHSQGTITERYIHAAQIIFPGAAARAEERMFGPPAAQPVNPD